MKRLLLLSILVVVLSMPAGARAGLQEVMDFYDKVQAHLATTNYDALEKTIDTLRRNDQHFAGGVSGTYLFYRAVGDRPLYSNLWNANRSRGITEEEFRVQRARLEAWRRARPDSSAARTALANLFHDYAWAARGTDYSPKVTTRQWSDFRERLAVVEELLDGAVPADPGMYQLMLRFSRDTSRPRASLEKVYKSAVAKYPSYFHFYIQYANLLQTKWFGQPGEMEAYIKSLLTDPGSDIGAMAYSIVVAQQFEASESARRAFFQTSGLRWEESRAGFALREGRYGLPVGDWNILLYLASAASDRATSLRAVNQINGAWASWLWGQRKPFDDVVAWARQ